jgi:hypothetical protein
MRWFMEDLAQLRLPMRDKRIIAQNLLLQLSDVRRVITDHMAYLEYAHDCEAARTAAGLVEMGDGRREVWAQPDTSGRILEGSFNPYGNEQMPNRSLCTSVYQLNNDIGAEYNFTLIENGVGPDDIYLTNVQITGDLFQGVSSTTSALVLITLVVFQTTPDPMPDPTYSGIAAMTEQCKMLSQTFLPTSVAAPVPLHTVYSDTIVIPKGSNLGLQIKGWQTGGTGKYNCFFSITGYTLGPVTPGGIPSAMTQHDYAGIRPVLPLGSGAAAADVNVVGFKVQDNPIWTSDYNPGSAPIAITPAVQTVPKLRDTSADVMEGSFNPYGNGQTPPDVMAYTGSVLTSQDVTVPTTVAIDVCINSGTTDEWLSPGELDGMVQVLPSTTSNLYVTVVLGFQVLLIGSSPLPWTSGPALANEYPIYQSYMSIGGSFYGLRHSTPSILVPVGHRVVFVWTATQGAGGASATATVRYCHHLCEPGLIPQPVQVVAFDTQSAPLWTSDYNPESDPVVDSLSRAMVMMAKKKPVQQPDLSHTILEGSFNPYGNGQPGIADEQPAVRLQNRMKAKVEQMRKRDGMHSQFNMLSNNRSTTQSSVTHPYAGFSDVPIEERLIQAIQPLSHESREWAQEIIDDTYVPKYLSSFRYDSELEFGSLTKDQPNKHASDLKAQTPQSATPSRQGRGAPETLDRDRRAGHEKVRLQRQSYIVAARVSSKFASWGEVVEWLCAGDPVSRDLGLKVISSFERRKIGGTAAVASDNYWLAHSIASYRSRRETFEGLACWADDLAFIIRSPIYREWVLKRFPSSDARMTFGEQQDLEGENDRESTTSSSFEDVTHDSEPELIDDSDRILEGSFNPYGNGQWGYLHAKAKAHNREMHALNGNYGAWNFPNNMKEVQEGVSLNNLATERGTIAGNPVEPIREVAHQTGILGPAGLNNSNVPEEMAFRGASIDSSNNVTLLNDVNSPESALAPNYVRNTSGSMIAATSRPQLFGVGLIRRLAKDPLILTSEGVHIQELNTRTSNIRADQITGNSFKTSMVAALVRLEPQNNGDSMQSLYVKLWLYTFSRSWLQDPALLPLGGEPGKYDAYTHLTTNPTVTIGWNNATNFSADCGGLSTPYFPYLPLSADPLIAFHVSFASVPDNEPRFLISAGLLLQNDRGSNALNIALLALALAPYPCGMHTVGITTTDDTGVLTESQEFMPHSDLIHMPGQPGFNGTLHIVLPVRFPQKDPSTIAEANALALVTPTAGPTAAGALVAGQTLDVCAAQIGAQYTSYYLSDFLASWMALPNSPIDAPTLTRFRKQLGEITNRNQDQRYAYELACALAFRYPAMFEMAPGTPPRPVPDSTAAMAQQNFFGVRPHQMTADFPSFQDQYDFYLPDLNPNWWNKIICGAYAAASDGGTPMDWSFDGSPRLLQYGIATVRDYAVTSEYFFTYVGLPQSVYDLAFTNQPYTSILQMIRGLFTEARAGALCDDVISHHGYGLAVLHCRVNGNAPALDMYGHSLWEYMNTPRVGFLAVQGLGSVELGEVTPCVLPDIWVQIESACHVMALTPLLSPNKHLTGIPVHNGQVMGLGTGGNWSTPIPVDQQGHEVKYDSVPVLNEQVLFNARLVWNTFPSSLYTFDGNTVSSGVPAKGNLICQKPLFADYTLLNIRSATILTAKTTWIPFMLSSGKRVTVGVAAADGAALMTQIIAGRSTTGVTAWLVRNALAIPNAIVDGAGGNTVFHFIRRPETENSSQESSPPAEDPVTETPMS